jgi:hypothetical protein
MTEDEYRGFVAQRLMRVDAMEAAAAQGKREAAAAESRQELVQKGLALTLALLRFVVQLPLTVVLFKAVTSEFVVGVAAAGLDATGWLALGCWAVGKVGLGRHARPGRGCCAVLLCPQLQCAALSNHHSLFFCELLLLHASLGACAWAACPGAAAVQAHSGARDPLCLWARKSSQIQAQCNTNASSRLPRD